MPNSPGSLDKLRQAISMEKQDTALRAAELKSLTAKMKAYQLGMGPAPSIEEFTQWREATEKSLLVRRLQSGIS